MKLSEFIPILPPLALQSMQMNRLAGELSLSKAAGGGETYRVPTIGLDQVVNTWLRQQMAYRQQMIMDLQTIALSVAEIRSAIHNIVSEVFRRGIQWQPNFVLKCEGCKKEYKTVIAECEKCKGTNLKEPDETQKDLMMAFMKDANLFDKSFEDVLREFLFDMNSVDDGYLYVVKEYFAPDNIKEAVRSKVIEVRRLNPALVEIDMDLNGLPKNKHWVCYIHRGTEIYGQAGQCKVCDRDLVPVMYIYWNRGMPLYLLSTEIIHISKFQPSELYGWSPIMTIFEKALTLIGMDKTLYRYFYERKMPSSMVMVFTDDPESLRRERENLTAQMRADPNYVPMVAVSNRSGGRGRVDMVRLFHSLQEMDYLPVKTEIRERIAAMWGVTPAWQGAPEAFGGMSTQTTQLTVMSRVVEGDQRLFHEKVFPKLLEAFGVNEWSLELPQPEEKAEATRISFAQQRIAAANMLLQMGFNIKVSSGSMKIDDINFLVSGNARDPNAPQNGMSTEAMGAQADAENQQDIDMQGAVAAPTTGDKPTLDSLIAGNSRKSADAVSLATGWVGEIMQKGFPFPTFSKVEMSEGPAIYFSSGSKPYVAKFDGSVLKNIEEVKPTQKVVVRVASKPLVKSEDVIEEDDEGTIVAGI